jgi:PAS domain S-box-containing protein
MLAEKESVMQLDEDKKDELGLLASSFNDMVSRLAFSQAELKKNKDYLEGILESTPDIIITVSPAGKILMINAGAEKALGYQREEVIGKPIEMIFVDPRDREEALKKMGPTDNIMNYETRFQTKDGKVINVLNTISRLRDHNGEVISTIGISKDITREKSLQNYAAIGQVFTGIQHSMKNMLNACKGGAYMVRLGLKKDDSDMFKEGWGIVEEGISRMTDMSMHMLKYVKEWKPKFEPVDLLKMLSEIDRVVKPTAKDNDVEFSLNVSPDLPEVLCDAKMIHSAVMDIVSNAMDACGMKEYSDEEIPAVVLSAYYNREGENLIVEVRDNGCGMTEEVKKNIFTPFFSTKTRTGTGLGLSITSRMISAHGGAFDVDSEPNHGTIFRILLPIDATQKSKEEIDGKKSSGN